MVVIECSNVVNYVPIPYMDYRTSERKVVR